MTTTITPKEKVTAWSPGPQEPWRNSNNEPTELELSAYEVEYYTWVVAHEKAWRDKEKKELQYAMDRKLAELDERIKRIERNELKEAKDEYNECLRRVKAEANKK